MVLVDSRVRWVRVIEWCSDDAPFGQIERRAKHVEGSLLFVDANCNGCTAIEMPFRCWRAGK